MHAAYFAQFPQCTNLFLSMIDHAPLNDTSEIMGFSAFRNSDIQTSMRIAPAIPVERIDAMVQTSTNHYTNCRLYSTPQLHSPTIPHPGRPPSPPIAPRPLQPRRKDDFEKNRKSLLRYHNAKVAKYNVALGIYKANKTAWERRYRQYIDSIDLNSIASEDDEMGIKMEDAVDKLDPIAAAKPLVVFTHGRNSSLEDAHVTAFCHGFAREAPILLFEDLRPELQRIHVFRTLVDMYPSIKAFSGRSAGARNAAKASIHTAAKRLIFFTYPLVRDLKYRYADLLALGSDIEVLFVVGDGDPLAVETHLREVRHRMRAKSWWIKLVKGDHSFKLWTEEEMENTLDIAGQLAAIWVKTEKLDPDLSELRLQSSYETGKAEWTGWQPPEPGTPKPGTFFNVQAEGDDMPSGGGSFHFNLPAGGPRWRVNKGKCDSR